MQMRLLSLILRCPVWPRWPDWISRFFADSLWLAHSKSGILVLLVVHFGAVVGDGAPRWPFDGALARWELVSIELKKVNVESVVWWYHLLECALQKYFTHFAKLSQTLWHFRDFSRRCRLFMIFCLLPATYPTVRKSKQKVWIVSKSLKKSLRSGISVRVSRRYKKSLKSDKLKKNQLA